VYRFVVRTLPGNVLLNIPQNGVEARLLAFIQDPSKGVDLVTWFDFDRLLFNTDSATLRPESQEQLANIAAILKAYPNVHIKIGGYTDNTGDPQRNLRLSQDRADAVMADLIALGVSRDRLEAQGYGDQFPVADNSTAEGRAKNRRVSMRVTQKSQIAGDLRVYPDVRAKVAGYTDDVGSAERNLELSRKRANSVMAELVHKGISPDRLTAEGYGQHDPIADNSTAEGRAMNRHVSVGATQK
jgi:outer membrane protein OmpA-like peptidoglycan-associated protein